MGPLTHSRNKTTVEKRIHSGSSPPKKAKSILQKKCMASVSWDAKEYCQTINERISFEQIKWKKSVKTVFNNLKKLFSWG